MGKAKAAKAKAKAEKKHDEGVETRALQRENDGLQQVVRSALADVD